MTVITTSSTDGAVRRNPAIRTCRKSGGDHIDEKTLFEFKNFSSNLAVVVMKPSCTTSEFIASIEDDWTIDEVNLLKFVKLL
jgi:hypothetical protein